MSISKHSANGKALSKIITNETEGILEESINQTTPKFKRILNFSNICQLAPKALRSKY